LQNILCCPFCHSDLAFSTGSLACTPCSKRFDIVKGVPIFLPRSYGASIGSPAKVTGRSPSGFARHLKKMYHRLEPPDCQYFPGQARVITNFLDGFKPHHLVASIGSGPDKLRDWIISFDIDIFSDAIDVVGDGHTLPFKDNSLDGILNVAVLEHVASPTKFVSEFHRVLKPGGRIYVEMPFFQPYHESPVDYQRYTRPGFENLLSCFKKIEVGVGGGPASSLARLLKEFTASFFDNWYLYHAARWMGGWLFSPIKYLDFFLQKKRYAHECAMGFYFIGEK
jgi:SAM-dependent methyltransferase/uncharacterized protein YbaR (Trm112 family)